MDLNLKMNKVYIPLLKEDSRYIVLYGGAGSGKSHFQAQKVLLDVLANKGNNYLICRKVGKTIRHSCYAQLQSMISEYGLSAFFDVNKTEMSFTCKINGNRIISTGLDDVEKLKSIAGVNKIWVEEASEISQEDFKQLDLRLRGGDSQKQITMTFNPISALSWIKKYFFDVKHESATILKTTYKDNSFLDEQYKQVIENLKYEDEVFYNIYALGNWGVLGNLILTNYVVEDIPLENNRYDVIICGLDFGFNHPSAFVKIGMKDGDLYILDELYETKLTNTELIAMVKEKFGTSYNVTADSAEPDRIKEFQQAGFYIRPAEKGKGSVKDGIDYLRRNKIHIATHCINFLNEIQGWKYKETKDGVTDEPVNIKDDLMAATRYAVESQFKRVAPNIYIM